MKSHRYIGNLNPSSDASSELIAELIQLNSRIFITSDEKELLDKQTSVQRAQYDVAKYKLLTNSNITAVQKSIIKRQKTGKHDHNKSKEYFKEKNTTLNTDFIGLPDNDDLSSTLKYYNNRCDSANESNGDVSTDQHIGLNQFNKEICFNLPNKNHELPRKLNKYCCYYNVPNPAVVTERSKKPNNLNSEVYITSEERDLLNKQSSVTRAQYDTAKHDLLSNSSINAVQKRNFKRQKPIAHDNYKPKEKGNKTDVNPSIFDKNLSKTELPKMLDECYSYCNFVDTAVFTGHRKRQRHRNGVAHISLNPNKLNAISRHKTNKQRQGISVLLKTKLVSSDTSTLKNSLSGLEKQRNTSNLKTKDFILFNDTTFAPKEKIVHDKKLLILPLKQLNNKTAYGLKDYTSVTTSLKQRKWKNLKDISDYRKISQKDTGITLTTGNNDLKTTNLQNKNINFRCKPTDISIDIKYGTLLHDTRKIKTNRINTVRTVKSVVSIDLPPLAEESSNDNPVRFSLQAVRIRSSLALNRNYFTNNNTEASIRSQNTKRFNKTGRINLLLRDKSVLKLLNSIKTKNRTSNHKLRGYLIGFKSDNYSQKDHKTSNFTLPNDIFTSNELLQLSHVSAKNVITNHKTDIKLKSYALPLRNFVESDLTLSESCGVSNSVAKLHLTTLPEFNRHVESARHNSSLKKANVETEKVLNSSSSGSAISGLLKKGVEKQENPLEAKHIKEYLNTESGLALDLSKLYALRGVVMESKLSNVSKTAKNKKLYIKMNKQLTFSNSGGKGIACGKLYKRNLSRPRSRRPLSLRNMSTICKNYIMPSSTTRNYSKFKNSDLSKNNKHKRTVINSYYNFRSSQPFQYSTFIPECNFRKMSKLSRNKTKKHSTISRGINYVPLWPPYTKSRFIRHKHSFNKSYNKKYRPIHDSRFKNPTQRSMHFEPNFFGVNPSRWTTNANQESQIISGTKSKYTGRTNINKCACVIKKVSPNTLLRLPKMEDENIEDVSQMFPNTMNKNKKILSLPISTEFKKTNKVKQNSMHHHINKKARPKTLRRYILVDDSYACRNQRQTKSRSNNIRKKIRPNKSSNETVYSAIRLNDSYKTSKAYEHDQLSALKKIKNSVSGAVKTLIRCFRAFKRKIGSTVQEKDLRVPAHSKEKAISIVTETRKKNFDNPQSKLRYESRPTPTDVITIFPYIPKKLKKNKSKTVLIRHHAEKPFYSSTEKYASHSKNVNKTASKKGKSKPHDNKARTRIDCNKSNAPYSLKTLFYRCKSVLTRGNKKNLSKTRRLTVNHHDDIATTNIRGRTLLPASSRQFKQKEFLRSDLNKSKSVRQHETRVNLQSPKKTNSLVITNIRRQKKSPYKHISFEQSMYSKNSPYQSGDAGLQQHFKMTKDYSGSVNFYNQKNICCGYVMYKRAPKSYTNQITTIPFNRNIESQSTKKINNKKVSSKITLHRGSDHEMSLKQITDCIWRNKMNNLENTVNNTYSKMSGDKKSYHMPMHKSAHGMVQTGNKYVTKTKKIQYESQKSIVPLTLLDNKKTDQRKMSLKKYRNVESQGTRGVPRKHKRSNTDCKCKISNYMRIRDSGSTSMPERKKSDSTVQVENHVIMKRKKSQRDLPKYDTTAQLGSNIINKTKKSQRDRSKRDATVLVQNHVTKKMKKSQRNQPYRDTMVLVGNHIIMKPKKSQRELPKCDTTAQVGCHVMHKTKKSQLNRPKRDTTILVQNHMTKKMKKSQRNQPNRDTTVLVGNHIIMKPRQSQRDLPKCDTTAQVGSHAINKTKKSQRDQRNCDATVLVGGHVVKKTKQCQRDQPKCDSTVLVRNHMIKKTKQSQRDQPKCDTTVLVRNHMIKKTKESQRNQPNRDSTAQVRRHIIKKTKKSQRDQRKCNTTVLVGGHIVKKTKQSQRDKPKCDSTVLVRNHIIKKTKKSQRNQPKCDTTVLVGSHIVKKTKKSQRNQPKRDTTVLVPNHMIKKTKESQHNQPNCGSMAQVRTRIINKTKKIQHDNLKCGTMALGGGNIIMKPKKSQRILPKCDTTAQVGSHTVLKTKKNQHAKPKCDTALGGSHIIMKPMKSQCDRQKCDSTAQAQNHITMKMQKSQCDQPKRDTRVQVENHTIRKTKKNQCNQPKRGNHIIMKKKKCQNDVTCFETKKRKGKLVFDSKTSKDDRGNSRNYLTTLFYRIAQIFGHRQKNKVNHNDCAKSKNSGCKCIGFGVANKNTTNKCNNNVVHRNIDTNQKKIKAMTCSIKTRKRKKLIDPQEKDEFKCNFLATLRKTPCLWVYYSCPWFYPHCLSMIRIWKQLSEVLLFLLAIIVWTPCIFCMEACRACICCTFCTS